MSAEQSHAVEEMSYSGKVATIGFVGGLFWGFIGYFAYYFHFVKFGPALVLSPWALGDWKNGHLGQIVGIFVISFLSVIVAFIYRFLLQKIFNIWVPLFFGAGLWFIVFYLLEPIFPPLKPVTELDSNSLVTSICLYLLYGLFIGYSISYEYKERQEKK